MTEEAIVDLDVLQPEEISQKTDPVEQEQAVKDIPKGKAVETSQKEKLGIYKNLAIKLKKELLKTREELSKLKEDYRDEVDRLKDQVESLTKTLESERVIRTNNDATLEATIKNLRHQLDISESELQSLQTDFDHYKARATKLLQQANPALLNQNKPFEEERILQLKTLNDEQNKQIDALKKKVNDMSIQIEGLNNEVSQTNKKLESSCNLVANLEEKNGLLITENDSLRAKIEQMSLKTRGKVLNEKMIRLDKKSSQTGSDIDITEQCRNIEAEDDDQVLEEVHTHSNSSVDSSSSGYVHIKPTTFEIISRSSVLEDAQNQIDHLTKAYLDSENTNSLLSEQIEALKEEIRRIQRGNDRIELVNNLEYLKNILFKYLSLDSSQVEQRRRLIPVLSTVLKLSPEEANKLK